MHRQRERGSIVAYILIIAMATMFILIGLLRQVSVSFTDSRERYYQKVADEAAEAGVVFTQACLEQNNRLKPWATGTTLTPDETCSGSAGGTSVYVLNDGNRTRTTFSVTGDSVIVNASSAIIPVTGITQVVNASGTVVRTYSSVQKRTVTWDADLMAQASTSGVTRTCAILSGSPWCWGTNDYGQLGNGTSGSATNTMLPVKVSRAGIGTRSVLQIVASYFSNCILLDNGEVWCWGMGSGGQMGNAQPGVAINSLPVKTALPSTFKARQIAAGYQSFCALGDDGAQIGQVYCWGRDNAGQLGNGVTNDGGANNTPQLIAGPGVTAASGSGGAIGTTSVTSLSYGGAFSANFCAISAGKAYCWGDNSVGQIGDNSILGRNVPTAVVATGVLNGKTIVKIAVDGITTTSAANPNEPDIRAHSCALAYTTTLTDARVYCWGSNIDEAIGNSTTGAQSTTPKLAGMNTGSALVSLGSSAVITDIAVNGKGTCVLAYPSASTLADTRAYCWGHTLTRGDNNVALTTTPLAKQATQGPGTVFSTSRISGLSGGAYRTCSIANLRVYCWGANNMGQIGFGSDTPDPVRYPMEATYQRMPPERTLY